jgi:hypothetical protein
MQRMIHNHAYKSPLLVPIRIQLKPVHTGISYVSEIHFNIISMYILNFLSGLFTPGFLTKILWHFLSVSPDRRSRKLLSFDLKHISGYIYGFSLVLFMIPFLLLYCAAYVDLKSPESYPVSTFLFITLRTYRTRTHRYFCPSQESGILAHGRVRTAPV